MNSLPDYFFVCYYICFTDHRVVDMSMYHIYFIAGWLPDIADSLTQWLHNLTVFLILVALPKSLQFASSPMPPKCKHNSKTVPSSQLIAEDDAVSLQVKWQRADQLFNDELMPLYGRFVQLFNVFWPCLVADESTQYRHSSCAGKGSGRQLQQLYNIKSAQTARHPWQSTQNLDIAMQDKLVNPMAPGYPDDKQKSQISPWVAASIPPFKEQSLEVWPSFTHSQPGQPFSFKLPSQASTGGTQSTGLYNSFSSSGHLSIFSAPVSWGSSLASFHPMSECRSNSIY